MCSMHGWICPVLLNPGLFSLACNVSAARDPYVPGTIFRTWHFVIWVKVISVRIWRIVRVIEFPLGAFQSRFICVPSRNYFKIALGKWILMVRFEFRDIFIGFLLILVVSSITDENYKIMTSVVGLRTKYYCTTRSPGANITRCWFKYCFI